jgi:hypothetical protein
MPRFYFHLATSKGWEADDIGTLCPSADHATIEAWRTACEMSVDMLRQGQPPAGHRFEVCDEAGALVFEMPFSHLLSAPAKPRGGQDSAWARLRETMATTERMRTEMSAALVSVQSTVATTFALLSQRE